MTDTAVVVLFAILTLLPLFFTLLFYRRGAVVMFSMVMTLLTGAGNYFSAGASGQPVFQTYLVLSLIGLSVSMLLLILELLREYIGMLRGKA